MIACTDEHLMIGQEDFDCIANVSKHCSYDRLCPFIRERQALDLTDCLGSAFFWDVLAKDETPPTDPTELALYTNLLCGGTFTDCNGDENRHFGLKRVLAHFAYAAYARHGSYQDSTHGFVQKLNQDSVPVPQGEVMNIYNAHRKIARDYFDLTKQFICQNKDSFTLYKGDCDCDCEARLNGSARGSRMRVIKRKTKCTTSCKSTKCDCKCSQ